MTSRCIGCNGRGSEEHVDLTLPPPPCRLCHPVEAKQHGDLARETRGVRRVLRQQTYNDLRSEIWRDVSELVG